MGQNRLITTTLLILGLSHCQLLALSKKSSTISKFNLVFAISFQEKYRKFSFRRVITKISRFLVFCWHKDKFLKVWHSYLPRNHKFCQLFHYF